MPRAKTKLLAHPCSRASARIDQHRLLFNPIPACDYSDNAADISTESPDLIGPRAIFHVPPNDLVVAHRDNFQVVWGSGLKIMLGSGRRAIEFSLQSAGNLDADEQLLGYLHD